MYPPMRMLGRRTRGAGKVSKEHGQSKPPVKFSGLSFTTMKPWGSRTFVAQCVKADRVLRSDCSTAEYVFEALLRQIALHPNSLKSGTKLHKPFTTDGS